MATYYGTYGQKVQYLASDPSDPQIGQVWYNSTSAVLKVRQEVATNAWATGGNLGTARYFLSGAGASNTAALAFGGFRSSPPISVTGATELYNGTSWTANPTSMGTARAQNAGSGTQTAALAFGGATPSIIATTEKFNGTSWSPTGSLSTGRNFLAGCGTQTSTLAFGGSPDGGTAQSSASESFNGTSWTNTPSLNTARSTLGGAGASNTSAIAFGGSPVSQGITAVTESYNGSTWTTVNSMNTARRLISGAGTQTAALAFGGDLGAPTYTNQSATELWNGTSWTSNPTGLATARAGSGMGSQTSALCAGGTAAPGNQTEEWTGTVISSRTVTVS
jgi:hypothetical protein